MAYIAGYHPLKIIESLLNKLVQKGILTTAEAQEIIDSGKQPQA